MPRLRAIVIEHPERLFADTQRVSVVLWADVPTGFEGQYNKKQTSEWADATNGDLNELAAGKVAETVIEVQLTASSDQVKLQTEIEARWQAYQNKVSSWKAVPQFRMQWDGVSWKATP